MFILTNAYNINNQERRLSWKTLIRCRSDISVRGISRPMSYSATCGHYFSRKCTGFSLLTYLYAYASIDRISTEHKPSSKSGRKRTAVWLQLVCAIKIEPEKMQMLFQWRKGATLHSTPLPLPPHR